MPVTISYEEASAAIELLSKALADPFYPEDERLDLSSRMLGAWDDAMSAAAKEALSAIELAAGKPDASEIDRVIQIFEKHLSGKNFTRHIERTAAEAIGSVFDRAGREAEAEKAGDGRTVRARKDDETLFVAEGYTETDAMKVLTDQLTVSAGGFWDDQLSDSIKEQMLKWFESDLTREEVSEKMSDMVNKRLVSEGRDKLSDSYFDRLTNFTVMRVRNIGKFSRSKALGAHAYTLVNPMDNRTSTICRGLVSSGFQYPLGDAEKVISGVLAATSNDELKETYPFWKSPDEERTPVPPLHWGDCRTIMRYHYL